MEPVNILFLFYFILYPMRGGNIILIRRRPVRPVFFTINQTLVAHLFHRPDTLRPARPLRNLSRPKHPQLTYLPSEIHDGLALPPHAPTKHPRLTVPFDPGSRQARRMRTTTSRGVSMLLIITFCPYTTVRFLSFLSPMVLHSSLLLILFLVA